MAAGNEGAAPAAPDSAERMLFTERRKVELADLSHETLVAQIVNGELNDFVSKFVDYEEGERDPHGHGKRVPYVGWFWRDVDFASGGYVIGNCGDFVGFMESNKWDYPQRLLRPEESEQVTRIACEAYDAYRAGGIVADLIANAKEKLATLWPLLQSFPTEVEGFWIRGIQGQVGFAETEEEADQMIASLTAAGGGMWTYWKVTS